VLAAVAAGCTARRPEQPAITMPSPDGCYVQVWETARFQGATDYLNGPRNYASLRDLAGGRQWNDRIRSVRAGPAAIATAYTDENFQGTSVPFHSDGSYPEFPPSLSGQIESLRIDCARPV
jgi:hypothetical protein